MVAEECRRRKGGSVIIVAANDADVNDFVLLCLPVSQEGSRSDGQNTVYTKMTTNTTINSSAITNSTVQLYYLSKFREMNALLRKFSDAKIVRVTEQIFPAVEKRSSEGKLVATVTRYLRASRARQGNCL